MILFIVVAATFIFARPGVSRGFGILWTFEAEDVIAYGANIWLPTALALTVAAALVHVAGDCWFLSEWRLIVRDYFSS